MATLSDIAEKANLSIATVSRVLNMDNSLSITIENKRKIFEIAEELNYTKYKDKKKQHKQDKPLTKATLKSDTLAVIQRYKESEELEDAYYLSIRLGAEKRATELGYNLLMINNIDDIEDTKIVGGIAIGNYNEKELKALNRKIKNLCVIGSSFPIASFDAVNTDFTSATLEAMEYLYQKGHRKIAFIGAEETDDMYGYRKFRAPTTNAYYDFMKAKQLFRKDYFIVASNMPLEVSNGEKLTLEALKLWKDDLPTAILAANDAMAIGINHVLTAEKIKIPEDISLMGINDITVSRYITPPLTTVKVYTEEAGEIGIETVHNRITNPSIYRRVLLTTDIIERQSILDVNKGN
ncbi:MAG: LacI family DNA-binding transcriptional regulator [Streptococcaceae bacterium]|jgi:LacI family transcriptional regulator|nr:LacI family DNA-binding transcriptional regulator [Streptococcaceae bacterium]